MQSAVCSLLLLHYRRASFFISALSFSPCSHLREKSGREREAALSA